VLPANRAARVVDAAGLFVVPGYIDVHNHSSFDAEMRSYVKNGVTTVRFAGVNQDAVVAIRDRVESGQVAGPRILSCGPMLDKHPPSYPQWTSPVSTVEEAVTTARKLLEEDGVEALLVVQQITPDMLKAIADIAHEHNRPLVGQIWFTDAREASELGIDEIDNSARVYASREYPRERMLSYKSLPDRLGIFARSWATVDWDLTRPMMEAMVEHGVYWANTLVVHQAQARVNVDELQSDADYKNLFGEQEYKAWQDFLAFVESTWTDDDRRIMGIACEKRLEWTARFREMGGKVVTGTDMSFGGIMIHTEFRNQLRAGFTPLEILTAATGTSAKALRIDDRVGTVQAGKLADALVLNRDPLKDIGALRDIRHVFKGGQEVLV